MNNQLQKLLDVYTEEKRAYERILKTVATEKQALLDNRPLSEIIVLLQVKQELVREVELLDRSISREKERFKSSGRYLDARETLRLNDIIAALKGIIEKILAVERENETIILEYGGSENETETLSVRDDG